MPRTQAAYSGDASSVQFSLAHGHSVLRHSGYIRQQHAEPGPISTAWQPASNNKGTWSAAAADGCSLVLTDTSSGAQQLLAGPGGLEAGSTWQQVIVQDDGVALLAATRQQGQLQLWLWRQLSSSSGQQAKAWQQLPVLLVHVGRQPNCTPEGSIQAVFVQQGFSGLQLYVAHAISAAETGAATIDVMGGNS
uniref:Uncharacterized protein n=1 Tax=Tetradesmus obliquus TaxID=3088 RepID=A0A383WAL3_TETOB